MVETITQKMDCINSDRVLILWGFLLKIPRSSSRKNRMITEKTPKRIVSVWLWFLNKENRNMLLQGINNGGWVAIKLNTKIKSTNR